MARGKTFRVGLYARVSTQDQQTLPMQLAAMRDYAKRRGWTVASESKEVGSGAKTRPLREELLKAARRRELDCIVVWRLDRWGRSLLDLIGTLDELTHLGVGFVSLTEALDMTTPSGRALAGMLSVFAASFIHGEGVYDCFERTAFLASIQSRNSAAGALDSIPSGTPR